ncbi:MAG TPA: DUF192 domain-containing protein [Candidatus Elarobacter sp.]|nr:DUF192 domain-containing protein [Candidatus Elarobacter sp.]
MRTLRNLRTGAVLAHRVRVAATPGARQLRLLARDVLHPDEGLWLDGCVEVNTFGMRATIDVVFLDDGLRVLATYRRIPPNHRAIRCVHASTMIQLGMATDRDLRHGDVLALD